MTKAELKYNGYVKLTPPVKYKSSCEINVEQFLLHEVWLVVVRCKTSKCWVKCYHLYKFEFATETKCGAKSFYFSAPKFASCVTIRCSR